MRKFIIEHGKAPEQISNDSSLSPESLPLEDPPIVMLPQVSEGKETRAHEKEGSSSSQLHCKRGERAFFIAYDGSFVGFFEAEARTTPRQAFMRVAEEMASSDRNFDPEKLELHKPVLLRGARPKKNPQLVRGKLTRLGEETGAEG